MLGDSEQCGSALGDCQPATGLIVNIAQRLYTLHFGGSSQANGLSVLALCLSKKASSYVDMSGLGNDAVVSLKPMQRFARDLRTVLLQQQSASSGSRSPSGILLTNLYATYMRVHNQPIRPRDFNAFNVSQLIGFISHVAYMDGPPSDKSVYLTPDFSIRLGDIPVAMPPATASPPTPASGRRIVGNRQQTQVSRHWTSTPPSVSRVISEVKHEHWRSIGLDQLKKAGQQQQQQQQHPQNTQHFGQNQHSASEQSLMSLAGRLLKEQVCPPRNTGWLELFLISTHDDLILLTISIECSWIWRFVVWSTAPAATAAPGYGIVEKE